MAWDTGVLSFDAYNDADVASFLWTDPVVTDQTTLPDGTPTAQLERQWNWTDGDTGSSNVGPTHGQGSDPDGYAYTEASSPGAQDDPFDLEFNVNMGDGAGVIDLSAYEVTLTFYTNQRGTDNDAWCYVQTNEAGGGWVTRTTYGGPDDPNKVATSGSDTWNLRTVVLNDYASNASTRVRILVVLNGATIWNCDYGIDTVRLVATDLIVYEQEGHQFREDDGSESGASDIGSQDSNVTRAKETATRLRMLTDADGDAPAEAATLQYRKVGDAATEWRDVPE